MRACGTVSAARKSIRRYVTFYNSRRPHSANYDLKPDPANFSAPTVNLAA